MVFKPTCSHYGAEGDARINLGELGSAARAVVGAVARAARERGVAPTARGGR